MCVVSCLGILMGVECPTTSNGLDIIFSISYPCCWDSKCGWVGVYMDTSDYQSGCDATTASQLHMTVNVDAFRGHFAALIE